MAKKIYGVVSVNETGAVIKNYFLIAGKSVQKKQDQNTFRFFSFTFDPSEHEADEAKYFAEIYIRSFLFSQYEVFSFLSEDQVFLISYKDILRKYPDDNILTIFYLILKLIKSKYGEYGVVKFFTALIIYSEVSTVLFDKNSLKI